ncbi:CsbD family protein [Kitasatospora sp. CM 4170]|uniref:CsbD family protein n=1 Tax=Kitasatospora aburaviensis TaxID=67265 RepID=A0ABW1F9Z7_9ACTN|nr:CsbD family protein [Kitasatospora sp. CM 4170]WNM43582.1 CsbD family protein [Kitasatospora sp. CM 4170]
MSTAKKMRNMGEKAKGKAQEATGRAVGDPVVTAAGKGKQIKSDLKQAGEKVKDATKH